VSEKLGSRIKDITFKELCSLKKLTDDNIQSQLKSQWSEQFKATKDRKSFNAVVRKLYEWAGVVNDDQFGTFVLYESDALRARYNAIKGNNNEAFDSLDDKATTIMLRKESYNQAVDDASGLFWGYFDALIKNLEFQKARDFLSSFPECSLRMKAAGKLALALSKL
jgi:hypothetical protein